ncbi:hypothetical protein [Paraburkholderia strydomiana]
MMRRRCSGFIKAAAQGNATAENNLGIMYEYDLGNLIKNEATAIHWYTEAARQGNLSAQANLTRLNQIQ